MDKITDAKTEFRIKQWTKIIKACQTSEMTVVSWCAQHNIKIKSYYYWLRKLRSMLCQSEALPVISNEQSIVPLSLKPAGTLTTATITIHLPAASIDIHNDASKEAIEAVLAALKTIC
jgi:hypothetical protein